MKLYEKDIAKAFYSTYRRLKLYEQFANNALVFHIANEQFTSKRYTQHLKQMGLTAGVADYCVLVSGGRVGFIEFKRDAKCRISDKQKQFREACVGLGIPYHVCWDVETAIEIVKSI